MFTHLNQQKFYNRILWITVFMAILATGCSQPTPGIKIKADIDPEPIVGQIVTLYIEVTSQYETGNSLINLRVGENVNIVSSGSGWYKPESVEPPEGINAIPYDLEWRGAVKVNQTQKYTLDICVTKPGQTTIYLIAASPPIADMDEEKLYIISSANSAEVIPSRQQRAIQAPFGSTPTPTPIPVTVSAECSGESN